MKERLAIVVERLGGAGASSRAAGAIMEVARRRHDAAVTQDTEATKGTKGNER
jgi:hypothetical protein